MTLTLPPPPLTAGRASSWDSTVAGVAVAEMSAVVSVLNVSLKVPLVASTLTRWIASDWPGPLETTSTPQARTNLPWGLNWEMRLLLLAPPSAKYIVPAGAPLPLVLTATP